MLSKQPVCLCSCDTHTHPWLANYYQVVSAAGVLQNPSGRHEGRRVWGGGIVKYRIPKRGTSTPWQPWVIDSLDMQSRRTHNPLLLLQLNMAGGHNAAAAMPAATAAGPSSYSDGAMAASSDAVAAAPMQAVRTVAAFGEGLTAVVVPELLPGEGNVHSGATPPWLLPSTSTKNKATPPASRVKPAQIAVRLPAAVEPSSGKQKVSLADFPNKHRAIAAGVRPGAAASAAWMPKFGRVWNVSLACTKSTHCCARSSD